MSQQGIHKFNCCLSRHQWIKLLYCDCSYHHSVSRHQWIGLLYFHCSCHYHVCLYVLSFQTPMSHASVFSLFMSPQCFQTPVNQTSVFSLFVSPPCVLCLSRHQWIRLHHARIVFSLFMSRLGRRALPPSDELSFILWTWQGEFLAQKTSVLWTLCTSGIVVTFPSWTLLWFSNSCCSIPQLNTLWLTHFNTVYQ